MDELVQFLRPDTRQDVKSVALQQVLGLTGSKEGLATISSSHFLLSAVASLLLDPIPSIAQDSALSLINLTSLPSVCGSLLTLTPPIVPVLHKIISDKDSPLADQVTMILSNLSREREHCSLIESQLSSSGSSISSYVNILCEPQYNKCGGTLHYLATTLSNLSQLPSVREGLIVRPDGGDSLLQRILPFTDYRPSCVRRGGVVGTVRNCCLSTEHHPLLLSEELDLINRLAFPLCGPTPEEATDEEVESLPMDLQYLGDEKEVESDPDIRTMLLEALTQLCATKEGRLKMRDSNIYIILRQLHKEEKEKTVKLATENLVDILIKKEEEINLENYKDVDVPEDMKKKLEEMDKAYLAE